MLDYDGTLAPFHVDPALAFPYPQISELLTQMMQTSTRVVLVSGRPTQQLLPMTRLNPPPEIWGCHGLERLLPNGEYRIGNLTQQQTEGIQLALMAIPADTSLRIEVKLGGVALHWRGLPCSETQAIVARAQWSPLLEKYELRLLDFDGGLEICPRSSSKGHVVETILRESAPDAAVAYLGDDLTDEDAFRALRGKGLSVLVRSVSRPTDADVWIKPPEELTDFLTDWLRACGEGNERS